MANYSYLRQLIKRISYDFILRYLNSEDYRRRINTQLNKGEKLHDLRRFLFFAHQGLIRKRQDEDLANQSSCLTAPQREGVRSEPKFSSSSYRYSFSRGPLGPLKA